MNENNPQKQGIFNSWKLRDFISLKGKMSVAPFVRQSTGETFKSVLFRKEGAVCFCSFSEKLGELTPAEIKEKADKLYVHQMKESGNYVLGNPPADTPFEGEVSVDI